MNGFEVVSEAKFLLDGLMVKVSWRRLVERSALLRNINVNDFLCFDVEDGAKIERVGVLKVIDARPVVHKGLLKSGAISVAFIIAY